MVCNVNCDDHGVTKQDLDSMFTYCPESGELRWKYQYGSGAAAEGSIAGGSQTQVRVFGRLTFKHRVIWCMMTGSWPSLDIDHIDRNDNNNVWSNLRLSTHAANMKNKSVYKNNRSGHPGVHQKENGRWVVKIGNKKYGTFDTKAEAIVHRYWTALMLGYCNATHH